MKNEKLLIQIKDIFEKVLGCDYLTYDSWSDCKLFLFNDVSKEKFDLLYDIISEKTEYETVSESAIENNYFRFLRFEESLLCLGFFGCNSSVRIVFDDSTKLPCFNKKPYETTDKTTFWQFEVDHSLIDCGMCYIMRTATGSFIVIDSAHTYSVNDCERIHTFLRERTPKDKKIHIAGWFITHGHDDHVAQFMNYLNYYTYDSVVDKVYINLISPDHRDGVDWMETSKSYSLLTIKTLQNHPEIDTVRVHTGQEFYIDNVKVNILCSHEDVFPNDNSNFNDSSVVFMLSAEDTKILIPGDAGHEESYILEARYPKFLKADIVQQAHHGHFGTTTEFYRLVDADLVLFPVTQIFFDQEYKNYEANRVSIELADGNYYIASNGTVEVPLPYVKGNEILYSDETFESFKGVYDLWTYEYTPERKEQLYKEYLSRGGKPLDEYKNGF